jgi:hypothetical protein
VDATICNDDRVKRHRQKTTDPERLDEDALEKMKQTSGSPSLDGLTAVASGGTVLTSRGVADLQRLAGNRATRSLIETEVTDGSAHGRHEQQSDRPASQAMTTLQRQPEEKPAEGVQSAKDPAPAAPEEAWDASIKGYLGDNISVYHTLNNFGDQQLEYLLRIHSTGYAMLSLETQYEYKTGLQQAWTALYAQRGKTEEVTNGLPPHSSLHLRLFGERDFTQKDQSYFEGTVEVRRKK